MEVIMIKQTIKQRELLTDYADKIKQNKRIEKEILNAERSRLNFVFNFRYLGLLLVQGSSVITLLAKTSVTIPAWFDMVTYFMVLWFGLLIYFITSIVIYNEDKNVYELTREKFNKGLGSSLDTIKTLAIKQKRELVYIIGNSFGLVLVALNIWLYW